MATVVLQIVGAAVGGLVGGPFGATVGRALGAAAGYSIDQKVFSKDQVIHGGRLEDSRFVGSSEGTPVPRAYGRVRLGGQLIWATRFLETKDKKKSGGKGGGGGSTTSVTYRYFGNFAIGICEGPISHIARIWADGKELDQTRFTIRKYLGTAGQPPDPLIEAKQGPGKTPAFRNTAYVVFDNFPLGDFGNRIPQFSFEIIRAVGELENRIRSITLIPGATEFGYHTKHITSHKRGRTINENRHNLVCQTDWEASLDELQALCPNLECVSLVVAWFGTDLRAAECTVEPRVVHNRSFAGQWRVSDNGRIQVNEVSRHDGQPAYGGTPSDDSIIAAIQDLKSRGLEVTFYPFVMMDIPADNQLPDPYGDARQSSYPWRGRITTAIAPDLPETTNNTVAARLEVAQFLGNASIGDFTNGYKTIRFNGSPQWSYRRMILHYAHLCELAGSVDRFLIGSEMRGLTAIRDEANEFPFVDGLVQLASDCRQVFSGDTAISYAADWSEYFGHHPGNQDNDVFFNLDPLWASPDIDAVAIDNYMPLANWTGNGDPTSPDAHSALDKNYLHSNIQGGEGYDWYFSTEEDRRNQNPTPITDELNEPWIWAYKNLPGWWLNSHYNRIGGVRSPEPTTWEPGSKPVWFTETGCPAIDRGANQPNVFVDGKSSEHALPWFSKGGRNDLVPLRFADAHLTFWSSENPRADDVNPYSSTIGRRMVDLSDIFLWTWDARPFPSFPHFLDTWKDGYNWYRGHWLNGRLGGCPLDDLISAIATDFGHYEMKSETDAFLQGYAISGNTTPRAALEPLLQLHGISVAEEGGSTVFRSKDYCDRLTLETRELIQENSNTALTISSQGEIELPREVSLSHADLDSNYDTVTTGSRRLESASDRQFKLEVAGVLSRDTGRQLASARLRDFWNARNAAAFALPWKFLALTQGDILDLGRGGEFQVKTITDGIGREIKADGIVRFDEALPFTSPDINAFENEGAGGPPDVLLMNLPLGQDAVDPAPRVYVAAKALPWKGEYAVLRSPIETGFERVGSVFTPATIFEVSKDMPAGPVGRWDYRSVLEVSVIDADDQFESMEPDLVFAGANSLAVRTANDDFELLQFRNAEIIGENTWRLTGLLRAQLGTDHEMSAGIQAGATGALLNTAIVPVTLSASQLGLSANWKIGPTDAELSSDSFVDRQFACTGISARPLSPCHLRMRRASEETRFSWIRRTRLNGDSWENAEVPLDARNERFRINLMRQSGELVRSVESNAPEFIYSDIQRNTDFGASLEYEITVAQIADNGLPGPATALAVKY